MDEPETRLDNGDPQRPLSDRLDSWKKIAVYLKRDVSTVQRWERREGMPVHRHLHDKQGSVFAYRSELDGWWESRRMQLAPAPPAPQHAPADSVVLTSAVSPSSVPPARSRLFGRGAAALALLLAGALAWSPDGRSVVSAVVYDGEPRLTRIFLNGDPAVAMLGEYSVDPVWSPDGRYLIYSGRDIGTTFPVRAATADGRPYAIPSLILTRGARRLVILADSPALIVLRGDIGHKDLWAVDLQGRGERQLTALPPDFTVKDFDISADGSELIFDRVEDNSDMALIERPRQTLTFAR